MSRDGENDADEDSKRTRENRGETEGRKRGLFNPFKTQHRKKPMVCLPCAGQERALLIPTPFGS